MPAISPAAKSQDKAAISVSTIALIALCTSERVDPPRNWIKRRVLAYGSAQASSAMRTPIHPLAYRNLGMFAVANIAAKQARPVLPAHLIAPTPGRRYRHR